MRWRSSLHIELTLIEGPVPLDIGLGLGLGKSAQALDIYMWLSLQGYLANIAARAASLVDWCDLEELFGGETSTSKFREGFKRNLTVVMTLWPQLGQYVRLAKEGLMIHKGVPLTVPPKNGYTRSLSA